MPTVALSPISDAQFFDNNGDPLNGGKLFYYEGGSYTVQKTTYSTASGTTPNPNPIVLDSSGRPTASAFLEVNSPYNVRLTLADGTTVLNSWANVSVTTAGGVAGVTQIVAGTNITLSPVGGTGTVTINSTGGGGSPGGPNKSVQYNNTGTLAGTSTFLFDSTTINLTIGATGTSGALQLNGTASSISALQDINLYPSTSTGVVRVGTPGDNSTITGNPTNVLTITGDAGLNLTANSNDIVLTLDNTATPKVSISGPTATQYATGLSDNDLVNKYYVDNNGGGGGGGTSTLNIITTATDYTTTLSSNQAMIVLDGPTSTVTTVTINGSLAYPVGTTISFWNNSVDTMNIALSSGTMIQVQSGLTGTRTLTGYGMATAVKIKSAGLWTINGAGLL